MKILPTILVAAGAVAALASNSLGQCVYPAKQILTPSVSEAGAAFGTCIDADGDVLVVGARAENAGGFADSGAVYVFESVSGVWIETARLTAGDGAVGDQFGYGVAVSGDRIAVGAPFASVGGFGDAGAVYFFERAGPSWTFASKIHATDLASSFLFGWNVSLSGDQLAVARQGRVAVFEQLLGNWFQTYEVLAVNSSTIAEIDIAPDRFIMSRSLAAGARIYEKSGSTWSLATVVSGSPGSSTTQPYVALSNQHACVSGSTLKVLDLSTLNVLYDSSSPLAQVGLSEDYFVTAAYGGVVIAIDGGRKSMDLNGVGAALAVRGETAMFGDVNGQGVRVFLIRDPFITVGEGCPGDGGFAPELDLGTCALIGGPVTLSISSAPGGSIALVHLGIDEADIPIGAGCSLFMSPVLPTAIFLPLFGSGAGNGQVQVTVTIPPAATPASFMVQSFVQDPTTTIGFTSTNAVRMTIY